MNHRLRRALAARPSFRRTLLSRRLTAAGTVAAMVAACLTVTVSNAAAFTNPSPPFKECPAVGNATSCAVLLVFQTDGTVSILSDPNSGNPYDGSDDTEVGVLNNSGATIPNVALTSNLDIFGFDGDGICSGDFPGTPAGCPFDTTGYAGPGITYSGINAAKTAGVVNFAKSCTGNTNATCTTTPGLIAGDTAFFSLEENLTGASIVIPKASPTITTTPSPATTVGNAISDSAVLANGRVPGGTLTFTLFGPGDTTCKTAIATVNDTVSNNGTYGSGNVTATTPGVYNWEASYSGDTNNNPYGPTACGSETVTVSKASPSIATTPSGPVKVGGLISDSAVLSGTDVGTGTLTFTLYAPGDTTCQTAIATLNDSVNGNGSYPSGVVPTSSPGVYNWRASYSGDANNSPVSTACGSETVTVSKNSPSITTVPSAPGPVGGQISDSAALAGTYNGTGTLTFTLYAPGDTTCQTAIATINDAVSGNGTYGSGNVTATSPGTYSWRASYSGDGNNNSATTACGSETVTVSKDSPTITTIPSGPVNVGGQISDSAALTGTYNGTGTLTFTLYAPGDTTCQTAIATVNDTVSGDGTYGSGNITTAAPGVYSWRASYSGDANNSAVSSACGSETVMVNKVTPTISTTASPSVPVGSSISDTAALAGSYNGTGTLTFTLYAPGDTTCQTAIATVNDTVGGDGTYASGNVTSTAPGVYDWRASYSGDANNSAVSTACGSETVTVIKDSPSITTTPSGQVAVGGQISDSAALLGSYNGTGTLTFTLYAPGDTTCQTAIATLNDTVSGDSTYASGNVASTAPGVYSWRASYSGDVNNNSASTACGSETVTVIKDTPSVTTSPSGQVAVGGNISDTATLAGSYNGTGTLTFTLYAPGDTTCQTAIATVNDTVSGNAAYGSGNVATTSPGVYSWRASYSGDGNNNAVTTACGSETVTVIKDSPTLTTTPSPSVPVGGNVSDSATLAGSYNGTGTLTFTLYAPGDTTCQTPIDTLHATVAGNGIYSSGNVLVSSPGTYSWEASYSGDGNNNPVVTACGSETVKVTPQILTGRAYGLTASASALGLQLLNIAPTPDTGSVSTTVAETVAPPCVVSLSGLITAGTLCAQVVTSLNPSKSSAQASVNSTTIGLTGVPVISVGAVQSQSSITCNASNGSTTIAYLSVGGVVVISKPTVVAPNTKVSVLGVTLILNEQIATPGVLTVNAVHVEINALGLSLVTANVVLASSTSDIENCP